MTEPVLVEERRDTTLVLRLNRPDARNALTPELIDALGRALVAAEADPQTRAVVLTGTGDRAFCAGMDLASFASGEKLGDGGARLMRFLRGDITVPVVGAANATAVAGGFELLLGCDVVVASSAARFALPEVKRGLIASGGGTFVSTRIPLAVALELALTGDPIDAERAYALGLVNQVVAPDAVLDAALALAARIAANGPLAVQATKELVRTAPTDAARAWARLGEWQPRIFSSDDAKEGATAFLEKRDPVWRGS
ncbi:MAG TPA: enoyl-CoA hydratase-related protein [Acidimicrobiia bacterium]|nr:enoyl-CoA hydratase-related protein [Acidimicrobiia bacterium]